MKRLLIKQNEYIEELKRAQAKPLELLRKAKYCAGNNISACNSEGCTVEKPCKCCESWSKVWDEMDEYLKDNDA